MKKPGSASNSKVWTTLVLPKTITSSGEFEKSILRIRRAYIGFEGLERERFLNRMYYLLGWMVGDLGKNFTRDHSLARLELDLRRKYPENLPLGNFVMTCVSMIGIPCGRIADGSPRKRDRHGMYRWMSYFSEVVAWLHTACLGLRSSELTSYDPVKMKWMLTASRKARTLFLRGVADSDGTVSLRDRTVVITSEPNTAFFKGLFDSLGVRVWTHTSRGFGYVTISAADAANMRIFNPEIETQRGGLLQKLANARTFQRRWPNWLKDKVTSLQASGLDPSAVLNRILFEDNTYVKLKTVKAKQAHRDRVEPALGIDPKAPRLRGV